MKKSLLAFVAILLSVAGKCQMKSLFFGEPYSAGAAVSDSILRVLPGFKLVLSGINPSGKSHTAILLNGNSDEVKIEFSFFDGNISTMQIVGGFEQLSTVFTKYINDTFPIDSLRKIQSCTPVTLVELTERKQYGFHPKRHVPISFCRESKVWVIRSNTPH